MSISGSDLLVVGANFDVHVDTVTRWKDLTWGPVNVKIRTIQTD